MKKSCMSECAELEVWSRESNPDLLIDHQTLHRGADPVRVGPARGDMQRRDEGEAARLPRGAENEEAAGAGGFFDEKTTRPSH